MHDLADIRAFVPETLPAKMMPFEQQGEVKTHSERKSKSSLQSLSQNLMDCEHLMH